MSAQRLDLADLLTASGSAMAASNQRMAAAGAPALLREFRLELDLNAVFLPAAGASSLLLRHVARPNPQLLPLLKSAAPNVRLAATFIAAPSLQPAAAPERVSDP